jgi:aminoglycoside phosphotransferase (APT) family kinase protein
MVSPMRDWSAEQVVDEQLARSLIAAQFPQLLPAPLRPLGEGWDSTVWLLGEQWVFRFPRRQIVIPGLLREMAALGQLASRLPLPVPVAAHRGVPSAAFGWPWAGSRFLPGRELADAAPSDQQRVEHGRALGRFLRALHDIDAAAVLAGGEPLPVDPVRRADMPHRVAGVAKRMTALDRLGLWRPPAGLAALLDHARELPPPAQLAVCHGDLHLRHLLVGDDGALAGVIDWIDVCRGDPAIDLPLYWGYLPPSARDAFHSEYGPLAEHQLLRARVLAIFLWATLAEYGHDVGMASLMGEALTGLDRAVADLR